MHRRLLLPLALISCSAAFALADEAVSLLPPDRLIEQAIDHYVAALQKADKVTPGPLADDATLIRRLTLDLIGRIPTLAETAEFCASADPAKKVKLVDCLVNSAAFERQHAKEL